MKILFIETAAHGHHIHLYLNLILSSFKNRNVRLVLMITKDAEKNLNLKIKNSIINKLEIIIIKDPPLIRSHNIFYLFFYQIKYYFYIAGNFKKLSFRNFPDHIYINTLDHFDKALAVLGSPFGSVPFSGLLCKVKFHLFFNKIGPYNVLNYLYKFFFIKLYKIDKLKKIFLIDPLIIKYLKNEKIECKKLKFINDGLIENKEIISNNSIINFKKKFSISNNDFIVIIYGAMREDKGFVQLFKTLQNCRFSKNIIVIMAGKQDRFSQNYILNLKKTSNLKFRLLVFQKYIDLKFEKLLFTISNLTWAAYINYYGSSGVYFLSGYMKTPIVISNNGLVNFFNRKYKIGLSVDPYDSENIQEVIEFYINKNNYFNKSLNLFYNKYKKKRFSDVISFEVIKLINT